jgi:hypothetical protein
LWLPNNHNFIFHLIHFRIPFKLFIFDKPNNQIMEEQRSNAGQGLGIAGLVLGIMAIPMGIIPCTFYMGILFGIIGIVLSVVALTQANRGYGPKSLIILALVCSLLGLTLASVWGFVFSRGGARVVKEIIRDGGIHPGDRFDEMSKDARDMMEDITNDTATTPEQSPDMKHMTDSLKTLEGEKK